MISVKMRGGLGNQMFQYAFGRKFSLQGKVVRYDTSWYVPHRTVDHPHPRPLRITHFNVEQFTEGKRLSTNIKVNEKDYVEGIFESENANFNGYWQYWPYYEDIIPQLRREFTLKEEYYTDEFIELKQRINDTNSTSVHVRRGDYLLQRKGGFHDLPPIYYFNAIRTVEGDLYIASDDIEWCRRLFTTDTTGRRVVFLDLPDYLTFELIRTCKNNVITNSTFSWWAAVLNENNKVICPKHYPGETLERSDTLRYPKEWIKVEDYIDE